MTIPAWLWAATIGVLVGIIVLDLLLVDRIPGDWTTKTATKWVIGYVGLAVAFGIWVWSYFGGDFGGQFFAGYLTELSLSVDNLFVFLVILTSFAVPEAYRHRVLLQGIIIALVLRGILILLGAAAISRFQATFLLFGAFLLWTAWHVWRSHDTEPDPEGNAIVRWVEKRFPTTKEYEGHSWFVMRDGVRVLTPLLLVMIAIGTTDLLFALDSIPAVFGLTSEPYIVFTANAFALLGLRQMFFMLHGVLDRIVYLAYGLALVLAFIGVKMVMEGLHALLDVDLPKINTLASLGVIIGILAVTAIASLIAVKRNPDLIED